METHHTQEHIHRNAQQLPGYAGIHTFMHRVHTDGPLTANHLTSELHPEKRLGLS